MGLHCGAGFSLVASEGYFLVAACGFLTVAASLVAEHGLLVMEASAVVARGLSSCGSQAQELRLNSCGARAELLHGMWGSPGSGVRLIVSFIGRQILYH